MWGAFLAVIVVLAAGAEIYFSTWRMSVTPGESLSASNPFSTMFVLHNEGQFAMHNINFSCVANKVVYPKNIRFTENIGSAEPFTVTRLEANVRTSTRVT